MTLTTNIIILALLLTIIIGAMYYTRKLQNARRHIQEREQQIADLSDRLATTHPQARHAAQATQPQTQHPPMTRRIKASTLRELITLIDERISSIPPDSIRHRNQRENYLRYKTEITRYLNDLRRVPARNTESRSPHTPTPEPPRRRT